MHLLSLNTDERALLLAHLATLDEVIPWAATCKEVRAETAPLRARLKLARACALVDLYRGHSWVAAGVHAMRSVYDPASMHCCSFAHQQTTEARFEVFYRQWTDELTGERRVFPLLVQTAALGKPDAVHLPDDATVAFATSDGPPRTGCCRHMVQQKKRTYGVHSFVPARMTVRDDARGVTVDLEGEVYVDAGLFAPRRRAPLRLDSHINWARATVTVD